MNVETLSALLEVAGRKAWSVAWPMAWQVSLLVLVLLAFESLLRRRLRPAVRHALWLLVPIKLLLPPSLALPFAPAYWLGSWVASPPIPSDAAPGQATSVVAVTFYPTPVPTAATPRPPASPRDASGERFPAGLLPTLFLAGWMTGSLTLFVHLLRRTALLQRLRREAMRAPESLRDEGAALAIRMGCRGPLDIRLVDDGLSPALLGLRRPTILLPRSLAGSLEPDQRRAVLLHEIAHARRGDPVVHAVQTLLLLAWWWNPFVWLADARLRAAREECVDDAVAWELGAEAESYPATLLAVARTALRGPRRVVGLIGIFETRSALRRRIQRLLEQSQPARPGLGWTARAALVVAALVLLPMAPRPGIGATPAASSDMPPPNPRHGPEDFYAVAPEPAEERLRRLGTRSLFEASTDPGTADAGVRFAASELHLEHLLERHREKWPAVIDARRRVETLRTELAALDPATPLSMGNTRTQLWYGVRIPGFVEALERATGRSLGEDPAVWREALLVHLKQAGFDPSPRHRVGWDFRRSVIVVDGPLDRVLVARRALAGLVLPADQVQIEGRFIRLTESDAQALRLARFEPGPPPRVSGERTLTLDIQAPTRFVTPSGTNVLSPGVTKSLLEEIARRPGAVVLASPRVTTLAGRAASVSSTGGTNGSPAYTLEIEPDLVDPQGRIPLVVRAGVSEVLSVTSVGAERSAPKDGGATASQSVALHLTRYLTNAAVVPDGYSLALTDVSDTPPPGGRRLLVLVTVTRIDPAGNPIAPTADRP